MVNQKDYKAIAKIMKELEQSLNQNGCTCAFAVEKLGDYFESEDNMQYDINNPDVFNREQFLKACGVK